MKIGLSWPVFVLILVVVILVILWLLTRQQWVEYSKNIIAKMQASNPIPQPVDNWSEISGPDSQGTMTTSGTYEMSNSTGSIAMKVYGKQREEIQTYIKEAKFYFAPISEEPPKEILALISGLFAKRGDATHKSQGNLAMMSSGKTLVPSESDFDEENDLVLEYDFLLGEKSQSKVQTIAFIIDPALKNKQSKTHRATTKGVYVSVFASRGSVDCTLKQRNSTMGSGSAGSCALSSPVTNEQRDYSLKVKGKSSDNYYTLNGTWSVS
jgi:hypothetical protein